MRQPLKPEVMSIFGRKDSLEEVIEYIDAQLPLTDSNKLHALLMMYHNTLLHVQTVNRSHREYPRSTKHHFWSSLKPLKEPTHEQRSTRYNRPVVGKRLQQRSPDG